MDFQSSLPFLTDLLDKKPYDITVTPLFGDKTGHGTQALPTCSRVGGTSFTPFRDSGGVFSYQSDFNNVIPLDPGNVTITELKAKDKSVLVRWTVKSQEACSGVVVDYTIFYGTQEGPPLSKSTTDSLQRN